MARLRRRAQQAAVEPAEYSASGERRFVDIHIAMPLDLWSRRNRGLVIRVCARAKVKVPRKYVCVYVYVCMYACMYPV